MSGITSPPVRNRPSRLVAVVIGLAVVGAAIAIWRSAARGRDSASTLGPEFEYDVEAFARVPPELVGYHQTLSVDTGLEVVRALAVGPDDRIYVGGDTIVLMAQNMRFGQEELHIKVGDTVVMQLDNNDLYGHSFDVEELDVHEEMPPNSVRTLTFTATRSGKFSFYCGVPGHTEAGMVGTIMVKE